MRNLHKPLTPPPVKIQFRYPTYLSPDLFPGLTCILPISVGQHYHEGDIFLETAKNISKSFGRVIIVLADSLQRWTIAISQEGVDPESLRTEANQKGIEWKERNKEAINFLQTNEKLVEILHWDDIMKHPAIMKKLNELKVAYDKGKEVSSRQREEREQDKHSGILYEKVEASIKSFYGKKHRGTDGFDATSRFASCSREYLLEESAAVWSFPHIGRLLSKSELIALRGDCMAYPTKLNQMLYLLFEQINNGREYRIFAPMEIDITVPKRTGTFSPPEVDEVREDHLPTSTNQAVSFFRTPKNPTEAAVSDSAIVKMTQEIMSTHVTSSFQFSLNAQDLNGKLHEYHGLLLIASQNHEITRTQYTRMMELQKELTETLSKLRQPTSGSGNEPQTPHTTTSSFRSH